MILIKGALVIDPSSKTEELLDVLIEGKTIKNIAPAINHKADTVIEANGKWLVPGLIDVHVHLREPGLEWKETVASGAKAAIDGGYTTIFAMPNTNPVNDSRETTSYIIKQAEAAGMAKVIPIGAVSLNLEGKQMAPLSELYRAGCGAFSDDGQPIYDAGMMRRSLEWLKMHDSVICCHEEDKCLSCGGSMNESPLSHQLGLIGMPTIAEDVMVARDIELARFTDGKVHICHISSERGVELVRRAKADGIKVTCEVTPHHLVLTEEAVAEYNTDYKMSPPLRDEATRQALIRGIQDGTIDCIASDHAPHEEDAKNRPFAEAAMGILGLQTSLPLLLDFYRQDVIDKQKLVELMSTRPAQIFGLETGSIAEGKIADLTLVDPDLKWEFTQEQNESISWNSPFLNQTLQGRAVAVIVDGEVKLNRL